MSLIAAIAKRLGWRTSYHVACTYPVNGGYATLDAVIHAKPWLRESNFDQLREYMHGRALERNPSASTPNIISITRLGP
jgi:hypothetical protein